MNYLFPLIFTKYLLNQSPCPFYSLYIPHPGLCFLPFLTQPNFLTLDQVGGITKRDNDLAEKRKDRVRKKKISLSHPYLAYMEKDMQNGKDIALFTR